MKDVANIIKDFSKYAIYVSIVVKFMEHFI